MSNKKKIFSWNYISEKLTDDEISKLKTLYKHYHKLYQCYNWKYTKLDNLHLALQLSAVSLTVAGTITGSVTLNPIVGVCLVGPGVIIQAYLAKSNLSQKVAKCRFAYRSYEKIMVQLQSYLRGMPYDINIFLSDIKTIDDMVIDQCPIVDQYFKKYDKKFIE